MEPNLLDPYHVERWEQLCKWDTTRKKEKNKEEIDVGEEEAKVHGYVCKTIHLCVVCAAQLYIQFRATTLSGRAYNDQSESTRVTHKVRLCRVCRATATHKSIYTGKCRLFEEGSQSIVL
jgi:hypothetical protein